jgi:hypothetical protein
LFEVIIELPAKVGQPLVVDRLQFQSKSFAHDARCTIS